MEQLAALVAAARAALAPQAGLIRGDPGSGKSRLLAEVEARIAEAGVAPRVVAMAGFEPEHGVQLSAARPLLYTAGLPAAAGSHTTAGTFEEVHGRLEQGRFPLLLRVDDCSGLTRPRWRCCTTCYELRRRRT